MTRFVRLQLIIFTSVTVVALTVLGWYYLQLPSLAGFGRYTLSAMLPRSGGLYRSANVTYRGDTIGRVTAVEPTGHGVRATMSIKDAYRIPVDVTANVHSVSAVGEQYLDLVSPTARPTQFLSDGQTITKTTVPSEIGPALDAANNSLAALPKDKLQLLLDETSQAVGGLGPSLQRLVESTTNLASGVKDNLTPVTDIITNTTPILDSQVASGNSIRRWSANLDTLARQAAEQDPAVREIVQQGAPTAEQVTTVFSGVRDSLPQTVANLEIVLDLLKRYHAGVEQGLVFLPQASSIAQTLVAPYKGTAPLDFQLAINQPPPCMTGFLPPSQWRSAADTSPAPLPADTYCKIPQDYQGNVVRGARNYPCVDVPGKRAATPEECRSTEPYVPAGTNPWYGDSNQILTCPAPAARCDQPVNPGTVIPAPSVNNGMNPLAADRLPAAPTPTSDPITTPGTGSMQCNRQQPDPCTYTPNQRTAAAFFPSSGQVVAPDGSRYEIHDSSAAGDDGWREMLAPAG